MRALAGSAAVILALVLNPSADLSAFNPSELEGFIGRRIEAPAADRSGEVPLVNAQLRLLLWMDRQGAVSLRNDDRSGCWARRARSMAELCPNRVGIRGLVGARFGRARIEVPLTWWFAQHRLASTSAIAGGDFLVRERRADGLLRR